jgi:predicted enzyme related to lactoylglutathione lyase
MLTPTVLSAPVLPPLNDNPTNKQIPGKFIWFELASTKPDQLKKFYGDVFGWTFKTITSTNEEYALVRNGNHAIAGIFKSKPRSDVDFGALWIGMLSVPDPQKTVEIVTNSGGVVHTSPKAVPNRGTYALLRDPEGALFGVLKSDGGDPLDREIKNGDFLWLDLFAKDTQAASAFYKNLAGYEVTTDEIQGVKRVFLWAGDKYRAGIVPLPEGANRSGWLPYVKVEDVNVMLKKVEAAGGVVMVPPDKSLLDGNLAIFADPLGGIMGIIKWDATAASEN